MDAEEDKKAQFQAQIRAEFKTNAFLLINKMVKMASHTQDTSQLVDEILHSIFFLGEINRPKISPREIFDADVDMFDNLKETYPQPFTLYSSSLPRRSPFSCVLDMVVHLKGQGNEKDIKDKLQKLVVRLTENAPNKMLYSTTICICASSRDADAVRHYGVSMSTTGRPAARIMIAASCLNFWEEHVADAVMSYYPVTGRMTVFCVNIKLPAGVRCDAFKLASKEAISPCLFCKKMFSLTQVSETPVSETHQWLHGNCAEAECLSNLLREEGVGEQVQRIGNWTEVNKKRLRCEVRYQLTTDLRKLKFAWDDEFYIPQRAIPENNGEKEPLPH